MSTRTPEAVAAVSDMGDEMQPRSRAEGRSLDVVQRAVTSVVIGVVFGSFASVLALYLAVNGRTEDHAAVIGLWMMTGVMGLLTAAGILIVNRRRAYHPFVIAGLLPMAVSAYWILL